MNQLRIKFAACCLFALVLGALCGTGCASAESENMSSRPWNSPGQYDGGLPSSLMEGR